MVLNRSMYPGFLVMVFLLIQMVLAENPIITHKYTADPNAMVYNGRVYVYCSRDDNNKEKVTILLIIHSFHRMTWLTGPIMVKYLKCPGMLLGQTVLMHRGVLTETVNFTFISLMVDHR